ncbi:MAG: ABC transporter ATP-binding protein [Thermoanaerobaculales bacterium]|jgi:ABC-2 type transport system ATP-binding protein|nr:ABC transporter ATP-binding protein [Thermoanaerobaculales bacterium]
MIEVENLSKTYVDAPVVDGLSFFVPEGQVVGLLGPNGAGKTTAMRMMTAFLPPTEGRVVVAGVDLDADPVGLRRQIGYLPENVPLYPELRVEEYLRFRADVEGVSRADQPGRLDDVLGRCMLADVRRQLIGTLSKGYRQRVGLAGALIHRPPVLILDEPTVGLDPNQIIKIRELITELGRDHTVVLSTHILPEVEQVCERVLIIDHGRIVADGTPDALGSRLIGNPTIRVELRGADAAAEALGQLPGVVAVEARGGGVYSVEHHAESDPREAVFRLAVDRGWVLIGLNPERATLEDVFVRLTTADSAIPAPAVEEV